MRGLRLPIQLLLPLFFSLCLAPPANATKSRLLGMGDLSIVIEDESNMLNLWDFGHNPAGFLQDDRGPVVRTDISWDTYQAKDLYYSSYEYSQGIRYKADGDEFDSRLHLAYRKDGDVAFGLEGNYLSADNDFEFYPNELKSPKLHMIFSKSLNPSVAFGADLSYLEEDFEYRYPIYFYPGLHLGLIEEPLYSTAKRKLRDFRVSVGVSREVTSKAFVAAQLEYNSIDPDRIPYLSESYSWKFSGQTVAEVGGKLSLGVEATLAFKRSNFVTQLYYPSDDPYQGKEHYYFSSLRFRCLYDVNSALRLGLFYSDRELFDGFYDPVESTAFYRELYQDFVRHWGASFSYKLGRRLLVAAEYHLRDSAKPSPAYSYAWFPKYESLNLGIEARIRGSFSLRGGFIRGETNENPNFDEQRNNWENKVTTGLGYEPRRSNLIVESSYSYALKKFKQGWQVADGESNGHLLSLSFKSVF
ncbi:MAG: hypothetical protein GTO24_17640 [candidate division Zixibacteria bacterium]|nr:hypothetical protein [candidate division Zixibacteria bacterium]